MAKWIRDRNCFLTRFEVDPTRRQEFVDALDGLCAFSAPYYDRGCAFAFQGWARDPNEFVVFASWDENVVGELRATKEFQDFNRQMMDCCLGPVTMEQFSGLNKDRGIFDAYPAGASKVHLPGRAQEYIFR